MGEGSKQVRVDNWGIFFLQRLQMFFNKTDYCDLTLQFEGNVQLKVHRLVMNACTEYFQMLEQTCDMIDDVLIMPADLQADVVLPIVNFMYTGMLEFHMSLFDKLHKTAKLMNITVLTKLLDAQKAPVTTTTPKSNKKQSQHWSSHGKYFRYTYIRYQEFSLSLLHNTNNGTSFLKVNKYFLSSLVTITYLYIKFDVPSVVFNLYLLEKNDECSF